MEHTEATERGLFDVKTMKIDKSKETQVTFVLVEKSEYSLIITHWENNKKQTNKQTNKQEPTKKKNTKIKIKREEIKNKK